MRDSGLDSVWIDNFKLINEEPPFVFEKDVLFNDKVVAKGRMIAENDFYSHRNFYHAGQYFKIENKNVSSRSFRVVNSNSGSVIQLLDSNKDCWNFYKTCHSE